MKQYPTRLGNQGSVLLLYPQCLFSPTGLRGELVLLLPFVYPQVIPFLADIIQHFDI